MLALTLISTLKSTSRDCPHALPLLQPKPTT
jgi:hypothetical protein